MLFGPCPIESPPATSSGAFDGLAEGDLVDIYYGIALHVSYTSGDGNDVGVMSEVLLEGDLNASGGIDQDDLNLVLANLSTEVEKGNWRLGDVNNDSFVNRTDIDSVIANWTGTEDPVIPEPSTLLCLGIGGLLSVRRRG